MVTVWSLLFDCVFAIDWLFCGPQDSRAGSLCTTADEFLAILCLSKFLCRRCLSIMPRTYVKGIGDWRFAFSRVGLEQRPTSNYCRLLGRYRGFFVFVLLGQWPDLDGADATFVGFWLCLMGTELRYSPQSHLDSPFAFPGEILAYKVANLLLFWG